MYQLQEEERMILSMVDSVCTDVIADRAAEIDEEDEFPQDIYDLLAEQGLFGLAMPEEQGGFAVSVNCWAACVARLAQESPAVALMLFVAAIGADAIMTYGTDEQKNTYLPEIIAGEKKISFALTEPNAGSDVFSLTTSAKPTNNGYVISGNKMFISNAAVADYFCVFANVEVDGEKKPSAFIVDAHDERVVISAHEQKLGLHGSPTCPIFFDKVSSRCAYRRSGARCPNCVSRAQPWAHRARCNRARHYACKPHCFGNVCQFPQAIRPGSHRFRGCLVQTRRHAHCRGSF